MIELDNLSFLTSSVNIIFFQAGVTHHIQHQFEELAKQNVGGNVVSGENKKRKMVVIGQVCVEPLQALRNSGHEVVNLKFNFYLPNSFLSKETFS